MKGGAEVRVKSEIDNVRKTLQEMKARADLTGAEEELGQVKEAYQKKGTSGDKKCKNSKAQSRGRGGKQ